MSIMTEEVKKSKDIAKQALVQVLFIQAKFRFILGP